MEVAECPKCRGTWLTPLQLDHLEDTKFSADHLKGSILISSVETSLPCPVCKDHLYEFNYRFHSLRLDHCPKQHGFWLDRQEDKRVLKLMERRKQDAYRKLGAETFWAKTKLNLRWFIYSKSPQTIFGGPGAGAGKLPPSIETRDPATPYKPTVLPPTCPKCGGPINSMSVIEEPSHQFVCGWCHAYLKPLGAPRPPQSR